MKKMIMLIGMFVVVSAHATNDDVVNSQMYVDNLVDGLQTNLPAKTSDKVVTYTTTAGTTGEREIKTELGNESTNQADTGIPTVGTVKVAVDDKQKKINSLSGENVMTYTSRGGYGGGAGIVSSTPIYDSTVNTFDNGLVTAKTLNDAVIAGVNAEVTRINTPQGTLWRFNRTPPKVLPTTMNLPTNIDGLGRCHYNITTNAAGSNELRCSGTTYNSLDRGDFVVSFPFDTGITYTNDTCGGTDNQNCGKEIRGISACTTMFGSVFRNLAPVSSEHWSTLDTVYENGKTGAIPNGRYCYCKLINPVISGARWVNNQSFTDATSCGTSCASACAFAVKFYPNGRASLFGAVPVPSPAPSE